jgi:hypothetical protein
MSLHPIVLIDLVIGFVVELCIQATREAAVRKAGISLAKTGLPLRGECILDFLSRALTAPRCRFFIERFVRSVIPCGVFWSENIRKHHNARNNRTL